MSLFEKINRVVQDSAKDEKSFYLPIGILAAFGFPFFYYLWYTSGQIGYENLNLRIIALIGAIPLIFHWCWPKKIATLLSYYWYFYLIYIMPFFFTFMLLKNNGGALWQLNGLLALILLVLLVNWYFLTILSLVGISLAVICYHFFTVNPEIPNNIQSILSTYIPVLVFCALFLYKRDKVYTERIQSLQILGASIAHELCTPLATIDLQAEGLKQNLPKLISSYEIAKNQNLEVPFLKKLQLEALGNSADIIHKTALAGFHVIDMLLMNVKQAPFADKSEVFSMRACIEKALREYPLQEAQKPLIHLDVDQDFKIKVNQDLLIHVFFNLLRNALYYTAAVDREAGIFIRLENQPNYRVYFKDTGAGIEPKDLPRVFDRFFSRTYHGAGIGLTFCKLVVEYFSGKISVDSVKGEYTTFILTFPKNHGEHHAS